MTFERLANPTPAARGQPHSPDNRQPFRPRFGFENVVLNEGGYKLTDIKQDRGGQTYAGISRKFHPHWPGWSYIDRGQAPPVSLVRAFYKDEFWDRLRCDEIEDESIAMSLFDFGVNAGWRVSGRQYLHVIQAKTGARLAIPLNLRLDSVGLSVRDVVEACRDYAKHGDGHLLRKTTGKPPCPESMSWRFEQSREAALTDESSEHRPPSLHECRSLAAREYRKQGINTQDLLGHSKPAMTELYHDDRGLDAREGKWRVVEVPAQRAE